jgi:drug/metabolite transporter (DMT)-like permease
MRSFALIAFVIVVWGVNWPFMKLALADMPPVWFAAWRLGIATLFFAVVFAVRRQFPWPKRGDLPILVSLVILQLVGTMGLVHIALAWVEPGRSAILSHTHPLWAAVLAVIFLREKLGRVRVLGIALGIGGIVAVFNPLTLDWSAENVVAGHLLLLWSAFNLAGGMVHARGHKWQGSPLEIMPLANLLAALLMTGLAFTFEGGETINWSMRLIVILIFNGVVVGALGFLAYTMAARAVPSSKLALYLLVTPVLGLLSSSIVLGEVLTAPKIVGLILVSTGVALVTAGDIFNRRRVAAAR